MFSRTLVLNLSDDAYHPRRWTELGLGSPVVDEPGPTTESLGMGIGSHRQPDEPPHDGSTDDVVDEGHTDTVPRPLSGQVAGARRW